MPKKTANIALKVSLVVVLVYIGAVIGYNMNSREDLARSNSETTNTTSDSPTIDKKVSDIDVLQLWKDTNEHRSKNGKPQLVLEQGLNISAYEKCQDMVEHNYWEHLSPDGLKPEDIIVKHTSYSVAGENLAYGYDSASETVDGWKASASHNKNMLNGRFTRVGFGVCKSKNFIDEGEQIIVVQHLAAH